MEFSHHTDMNVVLDENTVEHDQNVAPRLRFYVFTAIADR